MEERSLRQCKGDNLTGSKSDCERKQDREKGTYTSKRDRQVVGEKENDGARCMERTREKEGRCS